MDFSVLHPLRDRGVMQSVREYGLLLKDLNHPTMVKAVRMYYAERLLRRLAEIIPYQDSQTGGMIYNWFRQYASGLHRCMVATKQPQDHYSIMLEIYDIIFQQAWQFEEIRTWFRYRVEELDELICIPVMDLAHVDSRHRLFPIMQPSGRIVCDESTYEKTCGGEITLSDLMLFREGIRQFLRTWKLRPIIALDAIDINRRE